MPRRLAIVASVLAALLLISCTHSVVDACHAGLDDPYGTTRP